MSNAAASLLTPKMIADWIEREKRGPVEVLGRWVSGLEPELVYSSTLGMLIGAKPVGFPTERAFGGLGDPVKLAVMR